MVELGGTEPVSISPTNAAGAPAPIQQLTWAISGGYVVESQSGNAVVLKATVPGTGFSVTANALSASGKPLTETKLLPDVVDNEAVALNLVVA